MFASQPGSMHSYRRYSSLIAQFTMQFPGKKNPPLGVIFDSAMGRTIDDVLALAFLHGLTAKPEPEVRVVSVTVSHGNLRAAAFCDAMAWFFTDWKQRKLPKKFRRRKRALPVGLLTEGESPPDAPMLTAALSRRDPSGEPAYRHEINKPTDTADVAAVIRNAFSALHDQNGVVILTGPATNLARVLGLRGIQEWIEKKVRLLVVAAGRYPEGLPDYNIAHDVPAARKLFAEWPTPVVVVGDEVGREIPYPASSIENDFGWAPNHPVVDAYRAFQPMPYDAPSRAIAAALHAVRPDDGYFRLSEPGEIAVLDDGRAKFLPSEDGRHRYLIVDPDQKQRVIEAYRDAVSSMPASEKTAKYLREIVEEVQKREEAEQAKEADQSKEKPSPKD